MEPNTAVPAKSSKKIIISAVVVVVVILAAWMIMSSSKKAPVSEVVESVATSTAPVATTTAK